MIRLAELDPVAVAREVCGWIIEHVGRVIFHVGHPDVTWPTDGIEHTDLSLSVQELTRYAQSGPPHCGDATPGDYAQTVVEALWTAAYPGAYEGADLDAALGRGEPEHAIDVVLRAALARERLEHGARGRMPVAWLAALAGLPVQTLRTYQARGELAATDGEVTCSDARRWLSGRGIQIGVATRGD